MADEYKTGFVDALTSIATLFENQGNRQLAIQSRRRADAKLLNGMVELIEEGKATPKEVVESFNKYDGVRA